MLADHVYIMFSHRGSSSLLSSSILVEITEPEILVNRTERKRKHAQTFSSFDDFLNEDDGDYKFRTLFFKTRKAQNILIASVRPSDCPV